MFQAGQLVEWNRRLRNGAVDEDAAWEGSKRAGARALVLSWHQSNRYIAKSYRSSWGFIKTLFGETSWSDGSTTRRRGARLRPRVPLAERLGVRYAGAISRLTIHACLPTCRTRANPYCSNSSTLALNRKRA